MSLFKTISLTCPKCGSTFETEAVESVNADRRPDLRDDILAGTFQVFACPSCAAPVRLEPQFNYLEVGSGLWIAAYPGRRMPDYLEVEDSVTAVFDLSYGAGAMPLARQIGEALAMRLTFGWPAIREKLAIAGAGLSDSDVELLKLELLRRLPEAPLAPGVELRLVGAGGTMLDFVWIETETEEIVQEIAVNRALLDEIAGNAEGWAPIRAQLENGPFLDMQKLYMGEGRPAG